MEKILLFSWGLQQEWNTISFKRYFYESETSSGILLWVKKESTPDLKSGEGGKEVLQNLRIQKEIKQVELWSCLKKF